MAEKSLDDQLKEIQIAREQAELEKLKEETALVRKQVNAKWYSGRSLGQITAVALTVVAVYSAIDRFFLAELKQKESRLAEVETKLFVARRDSLNSELKTIGATLDTLDAKAVLAAAVFPFPFLSDPAVFKKAMKQYRMIKKEGFYDPQLNPKGKGIANKYETKVVEGDTVIYDAATKLTWQGGNEFPRSMRWIIAKHYVDSLSYAGFDDWRLPTLEEAMSLMEPEEVSKKGNYNDSLYVDARFTNTSTIWTADEYAWNDKGAAFFFWVVEFCDGFCYAGHYDDRYRVRAVR